MSAEGHGRMIIYMHARVDTSLHFKCIYTEWPKNIYTLYSLFTCQSVYIFLGHSVYVYRPAQ
jgi:hypothetical protein